MVEVKAVVYVFGIVLLLYFGIPVYLKKPTNEMEMFEKYVHSFNKTYLNDIKLKEEKFQMFKAALAEINDLNSLRKHNLSAIFGMTKFSDLSKDEFIKNYLQADMYNRIQNRAFQLQMLKNRVFERSLKSLPQKVDWRTKKVVTKVNNQRKCGACWAFSTVETMESMRAIKHNILQELSVQELIDCAGLNNNGCNGGDICTLLYWIYENDVTVQTNVDYPLKLRNEICKRNQSADGVKIEDFSCKSFESREDVLLQLLAQHGPVSVAVNAILWQNYLGGVIRYHCNSSPFFLNHAVQIVGYDLTAEIPYYIVRNSWGKDFGDDGYLYIAIGNNVCGLANEVVYLDIV